MARVVPRQHLSRCLMVSLLPKVWANCNCETPVWCVSHTLWKTGFVVALTFGKVVWSVESKGYRGQDLSLNAHFRKRLWLIVTQEEMV